MLIGTGTLVNVLTVVLGAALGLLAGHRLPERTRTLVTDALGLVTLLVAALAALEVTSPALAGAVGDSAPVLVVLGALVLGGLLGSWLRVEDRLEGTGAWLQRRLSPGGGADARARFVEGFVTSSLVFCVGPLTILGSLNEGLGNGAEQLLLKSALDGFAALAFAASFGLGVMASALSVGVVQGTLTLVGVALGTFLPAAHLDAITATGGLVLVAVALRLLDLRRVAVGDLLPALVVAPLLVQAVVALR